MAYWKRCNRGRPDSHETCRIGPLFLVAQGNGSNAFNGAAHLTFGVPLDLFEGAVVFCSDRRMCLVKAELELQARRMIRSWAAELRIEQDVVDSIASWLGSAYGHSRFDTGGLFEVIDEIKAGAWR